MPLVVENGTLVSGANSYVSLVDANKYVTDRALTVTLSEGLLLRGADYINSYRSRFKGDKLTAATSSMQFPRDRLFFDGKSFPSNTIPDVVIYAQVEAAIAFANETDPYQTTTDQIITKQKADTFEREFDTRSNPAPPTFELRRVMSLLYPLLKDIDFTVSR